MNLFSTSPSSESIVYDEPVHACRMTRGDFLIHKGIRKARSLKPNEKGYLVIFNYGTSDATSIWCPHGLLDESQVTFVSPPKYAE